MRAFSKRLIRWLDVLLIVTMLGNLLPPAPALATPANRVPARPPVVDTVPPAPEAEPVVSENNPPPASARSGEATLPFGGERSKATIPASAPLVDERWYYPTTYLGPGAENPKVGSGGAEGRDFTWTLTTPENLANDNEGDEATLAGHVDGPNLPGWDLWNDMHCLRYDFGVTILNGAIVQGLITNLNVNSAGFPAVGGLIYFYGPDWASSGPPLQWINWDGSAGQIKTEEHYSPVRYAQVCLSTVLSSDTPWDGSITVKYIKIRPIVAPLYTVPPSQTTGPVMGGWMGCGGSCSAQHYTGGPINTYSGNYGYQATDLSLATGASPLSFERSYNTLMVSGTAIYSQPLGYGWTHTYDVDLTFPQQPGGEPGVVILKAPYGSQLRFTINPDGSYSPFPGIWSTLTRQGNGFPHTYVLTTVNQAVYTFVETLGPFTATEVADLKAADGTAWDAFGQSVAIDAATAAIGADGEDNPYLEQGAVYLYRQEESGWQQTQKILSPDPLARQHFGRSLTLLGDTLLVGAPGDTSTSAGSAYIFKRDSGGTWHSDGAVSSTRGFGRKVTLNQDFGLVGTGEGGIVTIYYYSAPWSSGWREQEDRLEVAGLPAGAILGDDFASSDNTAVVTAYDQENDRSWAYVFERVGTTTPPVWTEAITLTSTEGDFTAGRKQVALSGDTILVAQGDSPPYVFVRAGSGWSQQGRLTPDEPLTATIQGVALKGNVAIFDSASHPVGDTECQAGGGAYIFNRTGATWSQQATLSGNERCFGTGVALGETMTTTLALLGAPNDAGQTPHAGATYLYEAGAKPGGTKVVSIRAPQGQRLELSYTGSLTRPSSLEPALARVTDVDSGRYIQFSYDEEGRLTAAADHTNRAVYYGYDLDNNLTVVTDTLGLAWSYSYTTPVGGLEPPHYLHAITDPDGKVVERTFFDAQGRAIRQEDGLGHPLVDLTYQGNQRIVVEAGQTSTDFYSLEGLLVAQSNAAGEHAFGFDDSLSRDWVKDANGHETRSTHTEMGLTTSTTDALGQTTTFSYDPQANNLQSSVDTLGRATVYSYDAGNNLLSTTNALNYSVSYAYNAQGRLTGQTDENGHTTAYGYDAIGQRTVITDALGRTTHYEYDDLGRLTVTTDPAGQVTLNEYDAADRLVKVTENYRSGQPQNYTPPGPPIEGGIVECTTSSPPTVTMGPAAR